MSLFQEIFIEVQNEIEKKLGDIIALRTLRKSKEDKSFVTEGDLMVNDLINRVFQSYFDFFSFISEETDSHEDRPPHGLVIVLDPIDGTENFTSGLPEWGISLCCYKDGFHQASFLACPELDIWIKSGDIISKNTSRIRGLSSSLTAQDIAEVTQGYEYRIIGCCVYNMINAIRGSYQSFENPKGANSWDILAGLNIALENNLKITVNGNQYRGEYLQPNQKYKFKVEN